MLYDEIDFRDGGNPWPVPPRRGPNSTKWVWWFAGICVVGVLIGLLLPAIQPSGHSVDRKRQCASNLRQLGLGISQYTNTCYYFPSGTIPNPVLPLDRRLGWGIPILPYIDEDGYFPARETTLEAAERLANDDPVFAELVRGEPWISHCPASRTNANFLAIAGFGLDAPSLPTNHPRAGIFGDDRRVTPANIKDGTSQTMMLSESDTVTGPWFAGGRATVRGLDPANQPYIGTNRQLGGLHRGGANVLMADGSMKFLSDSTDPKILEALSTMAGGEKLPVSWDED